MYKKIATTSPTIHDIEVGPPPQHAHSECAKMVMKHIAQLSIEIPDVDFLPLAATATSFLKSLSLGYPVKSKAIALIGFSREETSRIRHQLEALAGDWHSYALTHNLSLGLAKGAGQLAPITPAEEAKLQRNKRLANKLAQYADVLAFFSIFGLANLFNDFRIAKTPSPGKEYGNDARILKHITFTQFDLLILSLIPALALVVKHQYLQTWQSPLVSSTQRIPFVRVQEAHTHLLTGTQDIPGAFHNAYGGILWVTDEVLKDTKCRNLIRTGLTRNTYETPMGAVPHACLVVASMSDVSTLSGTENDGRFTLLSRKKHTIHPAKMRVMSPLSDTTSLSNEMKKNQTIRKNIEKDIETHYKAYAAETTKDHWREWQRHATQLRNTYPLATLVGLDTPLDKIFLAIEKKTSQAPFFLHLSGPYGIAKTTVGEIVAQHLLKLYAPTPNATPGHYRLVTDGGILKVTHSQGYKPDHWPIRIREVAVALYLVMSLGAGILNIDVTRHYHTEKTSFQEGLDTMQFAYMLWLAWVGILGLVIKTGIDIAKTHDTSSTPIMDEGIKPEIGHVNEDISIKELVGYRLREYGLPHTQYTFDTALLFTKKGLFVENWDALSGDVRRHIYNSIATKHTHIPTTDAIPVHTRYLVATTNHPQQDDHQRFISFDFSSVVPWKQEDDLFILSSIVSHTLPDTPPWKNSALFAFLNHCRNTRNKEAILTRQVLVDLVRSISETADYLGLQHVEPDTVNHLWRIRVFEGPLTEIYTAYKHIHRTTVTGK